MVYYGLQWKAWCLMVDYGNEVFKNLTNQGFMV